ncbi:MAG: hypothetical protein HY901_17680 [Deltaproteobacteria bacterium]|nr:hypothetical protein [Deltaproteobacteria bacterium]
MSFLPLDAPRGQIVATVTGESVVLCPELARAGATAFRLNASHLEPEALRRATETIRASLPDAPIVVDLQGAKLRLGSFAERTVVAGETLRFALAPRTSREVSLPHPEVFAAVAVGDTLSCDDDRLRFKIRAVTPDSLEAAVLQGGPLRPRKGLNVVEHPVELSDLTGADQVRLQAVGDVPGLAFAFSFMKDGRETTWLRSRVPGATVVGKVERAEAIANLTLIDVSTSAVWICRGDLGAQLGMAALAKFVADLTPVALRQPVLMAGQVLEHLTEHSEPTRSEVCHLFDLSRRGYAGIVLSDETAIGRHPVRAVETAAGLLASFRTASAL